MIQNTPSNEECGNSESIRYFIDTPSFWFYCDFHNKHFMEFLHNVGMSVVSIVSYDNKETSITLHRLIFLELSPFWC